jgi:GT2 family glycosyltransferase
MLLSVVIPTYNEAGYLHDLLEQMDHPSGAEIIVVDDARSTDGAGKLAAGCSARYLTCEGDVSRARNFGAQHATGEYILFLDADQFLWSKTPLEDLVKWLTNNPIRCGTGGIVQTWTTKSFHAQIREAYRRVVPTLSGGYTLIERKLFLLMGGFAPRSVAILTWEDLDLDVKLRFLGVHIVWLPFSTVHRRAFTWRLPDGTRII